MALGKFSLTQKISGLETRVEVSGYVDDIADFSAVKPTPIIRLSLKKVTGLNSIGTRTWCRFLQTLNPSNEVWLEHCPVIYIKAFNQVKGTLTPNCIVQSFYMPYFSEKTGEAQDVLYLLDQDYNRKGDVKLKVVKDSKGEAMEADVALESFLSFLKSHEKSF